ncbi:U5 small nuclear ribonucleoprotein TSSC4 [Culicoides brevitarsis]|uniref:U5 small nuclear ribonucleoprotein TSSC4 n=1 Tax=Culicoides brevitarsis TaxID=469753 RepID=UPI00307BD116
MEGPDFEQKRKNLFACLDEAEKSINSSLAQKSTITLDQLTAQPYRRGGGSSSNNDNKRKSVIRSHSSRKESIFKRPELPIEKCMPMRKIPDYRKNPHKWKKYSLEDADCSDRTNTAAAFNFLREIERRKEDEADQRMDEEKPSKIVFKKSVKLRTEEESTDSSEGSKLKGSKVVMPEYVVGQKKVKKTEKRGKSEKSNSSKQLKLDHLMDDDEEDET